MEKIEKLDKSKVSYVLRIDIWPNFARRRIVEYIIDWVKKIKDFDSELEWNDFIKTHLLD